jgi:ABC-type glutathione transport system ATPase component
MPSVEQLTVHLETPSGFQPVLNDLHISLSPGKIYGLLGKSGTGKTVFAKAISGLLEPPFRIVSGRIRMPNRVWSLEKRKDRYRLRGDTVFMVFQSSSLALNPTMKIGDQIAEVFTEKKGMGRQASVQAAAEALEQVGLNPAYARDYPHQISGGMRQRVQIAVGLALEPEILVADEPTTGLDAVTQARVITLLARLVRTRSISMILISHDLRLIAKVSEEVGILRNGRLVENGRIDTVFGRPLSPEAGKWVESLAVLEGKS